MNSYFGSKQQTKDVSANFPVEPTLTVRLFFFANVVIRDAGSLADTSVVLKGPPQLIKLTQPRSQGLFPGNEVES